VKIEVTNFLAYAPDNSSKDWGCWNSLLWLKMLEFKETGRGHVLEYII